MDTLYTSDIPKQYHYAVFNNNYIDLYDTPNLQGTLNYYRVFLYNNAFFYDFRQTTYNQYNYTTATPINVTDNILYRRDYPNIMLMSFIFIIYIVLLLNIVTSVFKKGGLFGGLL